ncbi:MAG: hypothetical protein ABL876_02885 [Chitinophagaceae bacterium]
MSNETDPRIQKTLDAVKERFEKKLNEIKQKGAERIKEVTDESPDPNSAEATVNMTFDVKFKTTSIKFDVPKFSKELQKIIFDIPAVTMKTKTISWDVPATKMERRCIAKKPVITCNWRGCKTEMKCIYMDMPVGYMKRMEIKVNMPEFTMKKQELSFDKPVIKFETVEIILKLPQFHLRDLSGDLREQEDEFKDIGSDMEGQMAVAKKEMDQALINEVGDQVEIIFEEIRKQLIDERVNVGKQFDDAIAKMKSAIKILKENNATAEVSKMEGELAKLVEDYKTTLNEIDASIEQLNKEQLQVINSIKFQ